MYNTLAKVYDFIFPQNEQQLKFINEVQEILPHEMILEVGCATGNLTELLNRKSQDIIGIDLDTGLLEIGKEKYPQLDLRLLNMLDIKELKRTFDRIVCFGNTLVHLPDRQLVNNFFTSVYETLHDDGFFITQIIHYDRIINQNINHLKTIDNDHVQFIRDYKLDDEVVHFNTTLTIKETQTEITNSIPLLTLQKQEIEDMLKNIGFKDITFYGNLKGEPLTAQSIPLIFSCRK